MLDAAFNHEPDIETRAAHVGANHIAQITLRRQVFGRTDSGHRAGVNGLQRVGGVQLRHSAGIVNYQHRLLVAGLPQVEFQGTQSVIHHIVQKGIDDGR